MRRVLFYFSVLVIVGVLFSSCSQEEPEYDEGLLLGKWKEKSVDMYYVYNADYKGYTWGAYEDIEEEEAQPFTWSLVKSELRQIHIIEMGGNVPKYYTVTELTSNTLTYKDDYNKSFSFTKVK